MIPAIIHRIWFGDKEIPEAYENYWQAWQRQYPHYSFKTWRDSDIDTTFTTYHTIQQAQGMARKSDIARYEILYNQGGVYIDCDIMPYHHLDWQTLEADLVVCNEADCDDYCSIGMIASSQHHPILKQAMQGLINKPINLRDPNIETGPHYFRSVLQSGQFRQLDKNAFYPYLGNEPYSAIISRNLKQTFGIHVWGGSWFTEKQVIDKMSALIPHGDLMEISHLSQQVNSNLKNSLSEYAQLTTLARKSLLDAANHPVFSNSFGLHSTVEFEFLKCAFHLLEERRDSVIWQIGAADGILVDPLRPLMVNFDPQAVLLEPNPYLFQKLKNNYGHNQHTKFLNVALGREKGSLQFNAVNIEKAQSTDLPDWVIGLSSFYNDRNALGGLTIDEKTTQQIQQCVETIQVEMLDINSLLAQTSYLKPDILVIDVEGMDAEIVQLILEAGIKPKIIQFEIQCLPQAEIDRVINQLSTDYMQFKFDNDHVAYRKDFFKSYCDHIYVQYGIPTYCKDVLKSLIKY